MDASWKGEQIVKVSYSKIPKSVSFKLELANTHTTHQKSAAKKNISHAGKNPRHILMQHCVKFKKALTTKLMTSMNVDVSVKN